MNNILTEYELHELIAQHYHGTTLDLCRAVEAKTLKRIGLSAGDSAEVAQPLPIESQGGHCD